MPDREVVAKSSEPVLPPTGEGSVAALTVVRATSNASAQLRLFDRKKTRAAAQRNGTHHSSNGHNGRSASKTAAQSGGWWSQQSAKLRVPFVLRSLNGASGHVADEDAPDDAVAGGSQSDEARAANREPVSARADADRD
jgi:hypothetical protein